MGNTKKSLSEEEEDRLFLKELTCPPLLNEADLDKRVEMLTKYIDRKMFQFILEMKKNNLYNDHLIMNKSQKVINYKQFHLHN